MMECMNATDAAAHAQEHAAQPALSTAGIAWTGRNDGHGPEHARWHSRVSLGGPDEHTEHVSIMGFASDEGVRRNLGRPGASDGPRALRSALAPMALHGPLGDGTVRIVDYGDVATRGEDLETAQRVMGEAIGRALMADSARLVITLGGGHETAWPSYIGLQQFLDAHEAHTGSRPRWGVLNLDAHFDLREADAPSSGTPFLQMARAEHAAGRHLTYAVAGISQASNTRVLFERAHDLKVRYLTDIECAQRSSDDLAAWVQDFASSVDVLYLTIDLDVLPAHTAPGVSAPAALGVDMARILTMVQASATSGALALVDVVELNPSFDIDQRTAKAAARLITEAAHASIDATRA